jgi:hypothetical protein
MEHYGSGYSNWGNLLFEVIDDFKEINVVSMNLPTEDYITLISEKSLVSYHNEIPMTSSYTKPGIYICHKGTCQAPLSEVPNKI